MPVFLVPLRRKKLERTVVEYITTLFIEADTAAQAKNAVDKLIRDNDIGMYIKYWQELEADVLECSVTDCEVDGDIRESEFDQLPSRLPLAKSILED